MRIADTIQDSIVDGPGFRYVVFTQGCVRACPGCHNPKTHDPMGGKEISVEKLVSDMYSNPLTDGLTLSGGEPFMQPADCAKLARAAHEHGLNVWCYTGYTLEKLQELAETDGAVKELLDEVDVLIDGEFRLEEKSLTLKWRGSRNQRVIDMNETRKSGELTLHPNR